MLRPPTRKYFFTHTYVDHFLAQLWEEFASSSLQDNGIILDDDFKCIPGWPYNYVLSTFPMSLYKFPECRSAVPKKGWESIIGLGVRIYVLMTYPLVQFHV